MKKILALRLFAVAGLFVLASCGGDKPAPFEPPPTCTGSVYAQPEIVVYPNPVSLGVRTNGHCSSNFVVTNEVGTTVATISSSGAPVNIVPPTRSTVTYTVKYNGAQIGTVTVVVQLPALSMNVDKSNVPTQIAKNSSFTFRVLRSNSTGCMATANKITLPDANTVLPSISSSPQDSTSYTANVGSTADKSGFLTVTVSCSGMAGDAKTDSFQVRVVDPILASIDSVSQRTLTTGVEAHVHFYSKTCAFISGNGGYAAPDRVKGTIGNFSPEETNTAPTLFHSCGEVSSYIRTTAPAGYVQNLYLRNPGQPAIRVQFTVVAP